MESKIDNELPLSELTVLKPENLQQLDNILKVVLKSSIDETKFDQIIYGRPTWQSPPSEEERKTYKLFRASFSAQVLKLDTEVRWLLI